jgi:hypothetical protein
MGKFVSASVAGVQSKYRNKRKLDVDLLLKLIEMGARRGVSNNARQRVISRIQNNWGDAWPVFNATIRIDQNVSTKAAIFNALRAARIELSPALMRLEMQQVPATATPADAKKFEFRADKRTFRAEMLDPAIGLTVYEKCRGCMSKAVQMYSQSIGMLRTATEELSQVQSMQGNTDEIRDRVVRMITIALHKQQPWGHQFGADQAVVWSDIKSSALGYFFLAYVFYMDCLYFSNRQELGLVPMVLHNNINVPNVKRARMYETLYSMVGPYIQTAEATENSYLHLYSAGAQDYFNLVPVGLVGQLQIRQNYKTFNELSNQANAQDYYVVGWLGYKWEENGFPGGFSQAMPFVPLSLVIKKCKEVHGGGGNTMPYQGAIRWDMSWAAEREHRLLKSGVISVEEMWDDDDFEIPDMPFDPVRLPYAVAFTDAHRIYPPTNTTVATNTVVRLKGTQVTYMISIPPPANQANRVWFGPGKLRGNPANEKIASTTALRAYEGASNHTFKNAFAIETPYWTPEIDLYPGFHDARCALLAASSVQDYYATHGDFAFPNIPSHGNMKTTASMSLGQFSKLNDTTGVVQDSWPALELDVQAGDPAIHTAVERMVYMGNLDTLFENTAGQNRIRFDHGLPLLQRPVNASVVPQNMRQRLRTAAMSVLNFDNQTKLQAYLPDWDELPRAVPYGLQLWDGNKTYTILVKKNLVGGGMSIINNRMRTATQINVHAGVDIETAFLRSGHGPLPPPSDVIPRTYPHQWTQYLVHGDGGAATPLRQHMWNYALGGDTGSPQINCVMQLVETEPLERFLDETEGVESPYRVLVQMFVDRIIRSA